MIELLSDALELLYLLRSCCTVSVAAQPTPWCNNLPPPTRNDGVPAVIRRSAALLFVSVVVRCRIRVSKEVVVGMWVSRVLKSTR